MEVCLREFKEADFENLWELDQMCFPEGNAYSRRELAFYIRRRGAFTIVAEQTSDTSPSIIVGFIVAESTRGSGHIITIDVCPKARRERIGSALLKAAEDRLEIRNCHAVTLEAAVNNNGALAFYKRHGYSVERIIPRYYARELDAFRLTKELGPS
jgi:ribosomal-protein-alanine N-acetyltransferase